MSFYEHHGIITNIKNLRIIEFDGQTVRYSKPIRKFPSKTFLLQDDFEHVYSSGKNYGEAFSNVITDSNILIPNKESFPFPEPIRKLFQTDLYLPLENAKDYSNCPLALASASILNKFLYSETCDDKIIEWLSKSENKETMDMIYELYFEKVKICLEYQQLRKEEQLEKVKQYSKRNCYSQILSKR